MIDLDAIRVRVAEQMGDIYLVRGVPCDPSFALARRHYVLDVRELERRSRKSVGPR